METHMRGGPLRGPPLFPGPGQNVSFEQGVLTVRCPLALPYRMPRHCSIKFLARPFAFSSRIKTPA